MNKWDKRFMELTRQVATWSSCYKPDRQVGAVIVKNKRILTTGYNGAPRGRKNCCDLGYCVRGKLQGTRRVYAYAFGHCQRNTSRALLCRACRAKRHYSSGAFGYGVGRSDVVLHAPTLRDLRQDDHQRRHKTHCLRRRLSRRICIGTVA
mgnify:CR=1 FL=1